MVYRYRILSLGRERDPDDRSHGNFFPDSLTLTFNYPLSTCKHYADNVKFNFLLRSYRIHCSYSDREYFRTISATLMAYAASAAKINHPTGFCCWSASYFVAEIEATTYSFDVDVLTSTYLGNGISSCQNIYLLLDFRVSE